MFSPFKNFVDKFIKAPFFFLKMTDKVILALRNGTNKSLCKRLRKLARSKMGHDPSLRTVLAPRIAQNYSSIELISSEQIDRTAIKRIVDFVNTDPKLSGLVELVSSQEKQKSNKVPEDPTQYVDAKLERVTEENSQLRELLITSDTENKSLRQLIEEGNAVKRALIEQRDQSQNIMKSLFFNYLRSRENELLSFSAYFNDLADREIVDYKLARLIQGKEFSFGTYLDEVELLPEQFKDANIEDLLKQADIDFEKTDAHKNLIDEYTKAKQAEEYLEREGAKIPEIILKSFDRSNNKNIIQRYEFEKGKHEELRKIKSRLNKEKETYSFLKEIRETIMDKREKPALIPIIIQHDSTSITIYTPITDSLRNSYLDNQIYQHIFESTTKAFHAGEITGFNSIFTDGMRVFHLKFNKLKTDEEMQKFEQDLEKKMDELSKHYDYLKAGAKLEINKSGKFYRGQ